jgi:hypothetical protein
MTLGLWKESSRTAEHWLELDDAYNTEEDVYPKYSMVLKWDECCHFHILSGPSEGSDDDNVGAYLHVDGLSELNEVITRLTEARDRAVKHFSSNEHSEWKQ